MVIKTDKHRWRLGMRSKRRGLRKSETRAFIESSSRNCCVSVFIIIAISQPQQHMMMGGEEKHLGTCPVCYFVGQLKVNLGAKEEDGEEIK